MVKELCARWSCTPSVALAEDAHAELRRMAILKLGSATETEDAPAAPPDDGPGDRAMEAQLF